jgi:DNA-binding beta-propeller fold protein YncE
MRQLANSAQSTGKPSFSTAVEWWVTLGFMGEGWIRMIKVSTATSRSRTYILWASMCILSVGMSFPLASRSAHAAPLMSSASSVVTSKSRDDSSFTLFETGQVRPLALSPDGKRLFAVNTPDNRLEIFSVTKNGLRHRGSVTVGLEPIAVATRNNDEVWVVNHLSDSVSIVDISQPNVVRVVRTLLVGDEPRDIVFGGPNKDRAFITTAHRGQNGPLDPQLTTPSVGRADVWVFDAKDRSDSLGGDPLTIITLFTDTPRALAVTRNGALVYAAGLHTGNRTTVIREELLPDEALPPPRVDVAGEGQPDTGLIVKYDGSHWVDEQGRSWDHLVQFSLPDKDVFIIDALADPPIQIPGPDGFYTGIGTTLFNMVVNPINGNVYVSNTEARNDRRFEGHGILLGREHTVQGQSVENRITVISGKSVAPRHLNKHIDYSVCCSAIPNAENAKSLAQPMDMAVTQDGRTLFLVAFGSSKIGVFETAALESDTFFPDSANQIKVSGGGPSGIALDEARGRLYVLTRFDNAISIIDIKHRVELAHISMHNPEPESIVRGRPFLYDAAFTSSHGDSACASCHIFADFDALAWDLGNPDATTISNSGPFALGPTIPSFADGTPIVLNPDFLALKGPMTTQSLRGLANHGPMHWRGDRTGGNDEPSAQPDSGTFNEDLALKKFNVAFENLNGRHAPLEPEEMQALTDFMLQISYPPNPIRALDNSLTEKQQRGRDFFFGDRSDTFFSCNGCHVLDPDGNRSFGVAKPGFFGTDGRSTFASQDQFLKIPHLRNVYQKIGMFGLGAVPGFTPGDNDFMGDQIRGFGITHDGSIDTIFRFNSFEGRIFRPLGTLGHFDPGNPGGFLFAPPDTPKGRLIFEEGVRQKRDVEDFVLAFDTNLAPIVGQQITLNRYNANVVNPRIDLLIERAGAEECDLIAKGWFRGREHGYLYSPSSGKYYQDQAGKPMISDVRLRRRARKKQTQVTYTCVAPGSGQRIGLDRDGDGALDGDEWNVRHAPTKPRWSGS